MFKQKHVVYIFIIILSLIGFWLRYTSITYNTSYWNDESHTAIYARAIIETAKPIDATGYNTGLYQIALYYVTAISFFLFGVSEFAGRFPSVIVGTILIPLIFYITRKVRNDTEALIAAFLMTFSQIQLAWSTQLRPYIWLELFTLISIYLAYKSLQIQKSLIDKYIMWGFFITGISFLFHGTGLINGVILGSVFIYKCISEKKYKYLFGLIPVGGLMLIAISFTPFWEALFRFNTYLIHYKVFLTYHYLWLGIGAFLGSLVLWSKDKKLFFLLTGSAVLIISFALFKVHDRYVRYSLAAFPLLYTLFAIGVHGLGQIVTKNRMLVLTITIMMSIALLWWPIKKNKLIFTPKLYYSINADMRENPIVDYKTAFSKIEKLIKNRKNVIVLDAWYDRVIWYLPDRTYGVLFDAPDKTIDAATPEEFEDLKKQYAGGIVIIENWESMTSTDMQDYLRKNLKYEFDTQTVRGNEADSWSISVYSWGIE